MKLKTFLVSWLLVAGSLSTQAQNKVQTTTEADLSYLFLTKIEEWVLPPRDFVGINVAWYPYDCKAYDFIFPPDSNVVSLYYCPEYRDQVVIEYPQGDSKETKREEEKRKNALRTYLYDVLQYESPLEDN